jgi:ubiquitin-conjugating enzyme E2 Z
MTNNIISKTTVKRLISDIKDFSESSLSKDGIYYKHDESNMLLGYALIIGPKGTPYAAGNFLFKFTFPQDYPYTPPTVSYHTNDGRTRFNPNFYKNTKVCLSLLNTWKGEQWTSCQTIRSILLTLCSLLNENPLLNEPGVTKSHPDLEIYNKIIKYQTLKTAIGYIISHNIDEFEIFRDEITENFIKNFKDVVVDVTNKQNFELSCGFYSLNIKTNYKKLNDLFRQHHEKFII